MAYRKQGALVERVNSTATSGGTLTLVVSSATFQQLTGTTTHTVVLPAANTGPIGQKFTILNRSTGVVTVNYNGGALAISLSAGAQATLRVVDNSTAPGTWDVTNEAGSGSGSSAALTSEQKFSILASLANSKYEDSETVGVQIKPSPEEIGGDFWRSRPGLSTVRRLVAAANLNGFAYAIGGNGVADARVDTVERYTDDGNYFLQRQVLPTVLSFTAAFTVNNSIYVAGGFDASVRIATTRAYSDTTNTWTLKGSLSAARSSFTAGVIIDSAVTTGGSDGVPVTTIELYDYVADAWRIRSPLPASKVNVCALTSRESIYAVGGETTAGFTLTNAVYFYDVISNSWKTAANLPIARSNGPAFSILENGYAVGGSVGVGTPNTDNYQLNFESNYWRTLAPKLTPSYDNFGSGTNLNGSGYIFGGSNNGPNLTEVDSYVASSFFAIPISKKSVAVPTSLFVAAAISGVVGSVPARIRTDGNAWKYFEANKDSALKFGEALSTKLEPTGAGTMAGGTGDSGQVTTVETYNPIQNIWAIRASLAQARWAGAGFQVLGKSYAVAGYNSSGGAPVALNQEFNDIANTQTSKLALPAVRTVCPGFSLNGKGHVVGGQNDTAGNGGTAQNTNYQYDSTANTWITKTVLLSARGFMGAFVLSDHAFILGGNYFTSALNTVDRYSHITDSWLNRANMSSQRHESPGLSLNEFGYAIGGYNTGGPVNTTEKYNQATNAWSASATLNGLRGRNRAWIANGHGYTAGGEIGAYTNTVERFNDAASTYTNVATMSENKSFMMAATPGPYYNYELQIGLPTYLAALGSGQWINRTNIPTGTQTALGFNLGGHLFVVSGSPTATGNQKYNPASDSWYNDTPYPINSQNFCGWNTAVNGFGHGIGDGAGVTGQNYRYSDATRAWNQTVNLPVATYQGGVGCLNGFTYSISGIASGTIQTTNYQYNDATNAFATKTAVTTGRVNAGTAAHDGLLYNTGGNQTGAFPGNLRDHNEAYNDASNSWISRAVVPTALASQVCFIIPEGNIQAGGYNGAAVATVTMYRPDLNAWYLKTSLPAGRNSGTSGTADGVGYAITGGDGVGNSQLNTAYTPAIKNIVLGAALKVS